MVCGRGGHLSGNIGGVEACQKLEVPDAVASILGELDLKPAVLPTLPPRRVVNHKIELVHLGMQTCFGTLENDASGVS